MSKLDIVKRVKLAEDSFFLSITINPMHVLNIAVKNNVDPKKKKRLKTRFLLKKYKMLKKSFNEKR